MTDLLIRGASVFDGLGHPPARLDVAVEQGRIAALGPRLDMPAREVREAAGLWLAPGFLDIHTHYDLEVEIAPGLSESVRHGVTSVVMGNCSLSLTMGRPETLADIFLRVENMPRVLVRKWLERAVRGNRPAEYLAHLRGLPKGANVAPMLGHSPLRAEVMGLARSLEAHATDEELARMRALATEALEAGCVGISVDMVPWHMMSGEFRGRTIPSQHADVREYRMLAEVCREKDVVFQVSPNPQDLTSLWTLLRLALPRGGRPLRLTVLAALDVVHHRALWRGYAPLLRALDALGTNVRFQTLAEAFTVYSDGPLTPLFEEFPAGVALNDAETPEERRALWRDPAFREAFRAQWTGGWRKTFHRRLDAMRIVGSPDPGLVGRTFVEVANARGGDPVLTFMDLLAEHDRELRWVATGANDRRGPLLRLLRDPFILPGFTDAGAHVRNLGYYDAPLTLLRHAVATGALSPEKAIHRVTAEAARWFRLDTGQIKVGGRADLVLLRPDELRSPVTEQTEIADPVLDGALRMVKRGGERAIAAVFVGGVLAVEDGRPLPALGRDTRGEVLTVDPEALDAASAARRRRNRIDDLTLDHPFADYWPVFVLKHQDPRNVLCHAIGLGLLYAVPACAWAFANPWILLAYPLSQAIGLLGHALFERSHIEARDAVCSWRATVALHRLFVRLATGRYWPEVVELRSRLEAYERQRRGRPASPSPERAAEVA